MLLQNKKANKPEECLDFPDLLKFKDPKTANMFVVSCSYALAMGLWITVGKTSDGTKGLITLKDAKSEKIAQVAFTDNVTLVAALEEFSADIASIAASKSL